MGILADLARLRPMMPFEQLLALIGTDVRPSPAGWLSEGVRFAARIDAEGKIGTLAFEQRFPSTISLDGLHVGMHLDDLLASRFGFAMAGPRTFRFLLTDYIGKTDAGDDVIARVTWKGLVNSLEFSRPGRIYPEGERRFATHFNISPRSYTDPSEMLFDWAYGHSQTEDHDTFPVFAKWLVEQSTPDDLYRFVSNWNWDFGIEPLLWVVQQPNCDVATALHAFYWTHPAQLLKERTETPRYSLDEFDLVYEIRRRFLDGFYTRSSLAFDAALAFREQVYVEGGADDEAVRRAIPEAMRAVFPGRVLPDLPAIDVWDFRPVHPRRKSTIVPPPFSEAELLEVEAVKARVEAMRKAPPTKS